MIGRDDPNDRIDGPGWRDRLVDAPANVTPWDGQDRIFTRSRGAAAPWHGVLCSHLVRNEGRSLKCLAGQVGWFYLRLTRQEVEDLIDSAKAKKLIELESADAADGSRIPDADRRWLATEKGEKLHAPRGAGARDLTKRIIPTAREVYGTTKIAVEAGALVLVGVFGLNLLFKAGGLGAELAFIAALVVFGAAVLIGGLSDERALTAMARAWPRLAAYRPDAYRFETTTLRTPGPVTALAALAVLATFAASWRLQAHGKLSDPWWWPISVLGTILLLMGVLIAQEALTRRAAGLRAAYNGEHGQRRKPEEDR